LSFDLKVSHIIDRIIRIKSKIPVISAVVLDRAFTEGINEKLGNILNVEHSMARLLHCDAEVPHYLGWIRPLTGKTLSSSISNQLPLVLVGMSLTRITIGKCLL